MAHGRFGKVCESDEEIEEETPEKRFNSKYFKIFAPIILLAVFYTACYSHTDE